MHVFEDRNLVPTATFASSSVMTSPLEKLLGPYALAEVQKVLPLIRGSSKGSYPVDKHG